MNRRKPVGTFDAHGRRDDCTPIAALSDVASVAKPLHEHMPRLRDALHGPAFLPRFAREAVTGERRNHQMKSVARIAAMRRRIDERPDALQELDHRSRPAVRENQRQRIARAGPDMQEMNLHAVDARAVLAEAIERRFATTPVVPRTPIVHERLHVCERRALRPVVHDFRFRPAR